MQKNRISSKIKCLFVFCITIALTLTTSCKKRKRNEGLISISCIPTAINIAETSQCTAIDIHSMKEITSSSVTWFSSDSTIATVASTGLVTGITAGTTTITAVSGSNVSNMVELTINTNNSYFPAGYYTNTSGGNFPLLAVSTDSGNTWTYKITSANMPSDQVPNASAQNAPFCSIYKC